MLINDVLMPFVIINAMLAKLGVKQIRNSTILAVMVQGVLH